MGRVCDGPPTRHLIRVLWVLTSPSHHLNTHKESSVHMHKLQPSLYHIYNQSTHCLDNPDTLPHLSFRLAISISNKITVKNGVKYCLVILNNRLHVLLLQEIKHIKTSIKTEICYLKHPQQRSACAGLSPNSICQSQHFRMYCNLVSKDMFLFRVPVAILLFESQHTLQ